MIESGEDQVPAMVRAIRVLREHNATFSEPPRLIGSPLLRDKREVSLYSEISAGHPSAVCADAPADKIRLPADLATHADFAVIVRGDSMEPMVSDGDVAVFRAAQTAGNGQFVAAVVDGQMLLKRFTRPRKGRARLEKPERSLRADPLARRRAHPGRVRRPLQPGAQILKLGKQRLGQAWN